MTAVYILLGIIIILLVVSIYTTGKWDLTNTKQHKELFAGLAKHTSSEEIMKYCKALRDDALKIIVSIDDLKEDTNVIKRDLLIARLYTSADTLRAPIEKATTASQVKAAKKKIATKKKTVKKKR